jgi:type VI secretion system protein ImpJ
MDASGWPVLDPTLLPSPVRTSALRPAAMRQMQRVLWNKGVLLSPQHLQMQDRFLEDQLHFQLSALAFHPWGVARLEVDREALAGGSLVVTAATGLFRDGLAFEIPESDVAPPPKPLPDFWQPDAHWLDLYLAVPEHQVGGYNVATAQGGQNTRYVAEVVMRRDENTGLAEKPIQLARKNLRLLAEGEALEGSSVLRIARVVRGATGGYQLDPHFVPPSIDTGASEFLLAINRRLVELLVTKSGTLAAMRRQRNQSLADFGVSDVANFWLLYTVNTHLPRLRHLFETRRGHPADLFAAMLELAGALTTFAANLDPRDLPEYDHSDPGPAFARLDEIVRELLETVVPANHVTLPLRETEPSIHATAIEQDHYLTAPQMLLAIRAEMKQDELVRGVPRLLKVSSGDGIDRLVRQAVGGVGLQHLPTPPSSLPIKLNYHYFQLDRSGPHWEAIRTAHNLAVYVPSDFAEPQLELVVLLPRSEARKR